MDNRTCNALLRGLRCLGERGFAILTGRWRALHHTTASPSKIGNSYPGRFERRAGRWRIARRMVVDDWSRLDEVVNVAPSITPDCQQGTRDASDPSYRLSDFTQVFGG